MTKHNFSQLYKNTKKHIFTRSNFLAFYLVFMFFFSCKEVPSDKYSMNIYQTSQAGENLSLINLDNSRNNYEKANKIKLRLQPDQTFQEYIGFGASFTESSAWNLATIPENLRKEVLVKLFSPTDGAGFSLTRTHINSSDYSNNHYTYVDDGDESLNSFSIYEDLKGFTGDENEQVQEIELVEPSYDIIPMILEASEVTEADFKIVASPWSPPSWMKSGETGEMTNGSLMPKYYNLWASYLSKYISAYKEQGIDIWAITPQNEPLHAHDARWDSNGFTPEQGLEFLRDHLGPQLVNDGHLNINDLESGLRVLIYDHNKSTMLDYVTPTYNDPEAAKYAWGTAFHWYANSELDENNWYSEDLKTHRKNWPNKGLIHTESSIDIDADDPIGQYWRESTDYAGVFVPFDTYAYDIISNLNSGTQGYIEWCMILSHKGQPNPYDNFNSAPVLINPETDQVIYTPLYYLLSHFSKFIRPNALRIGVEGDNITGVTYTVAKNEDDSIVVVIFNSNKEPYELDITLEEGIYTSIIAPRSLQTIHLGKTKTTE
ncbi:MAG: glycoside hydrolase family 30 protein [bacterium]